MISQGTLMSCGTAVGKHWSKGILLFQGFSVPLQAENGKQGRVSRLVRWRGGSGFHSNSWWGVVVPAEGPRRGSERPDTPIVRHRPPMAPGCQRGRTAEAAAPHPPHTFPVICHAGLELSVRDRCLHIPDLIWFLLDEAFEAPKTNQRHIIVW